MNDRLQFRVLYREFLFRMVDLELLSAQPRGDMSKLFGQFAALLISVSVILAIGGLTSTGRMGPAQRLLFSWNNEHSLIVDTMLAVGLFAVLSWDSTFPDKRDVMVLAPLPIRSQTLFLAKITGVAAALSITVASLHCITTLTWPGVFAGQPAVTYAGQFIPASGGFMSFVRTFAAYWITMFASGAFIFCCVLGAQGIAALALPRRLYLRASSAMQLAAFCLFVSGYFLLPTAATPQNLAAAQGNGAGAWQFSFWFLGLFQELKGSPALPVLAHRAWIGSSVVMSITASTYLLSYFRVLRKIVEEPDITSSARGARWLPPFGNALQTAIGQFSVRSLLRSRQHRMLLAFYLGMGFVFNILLFKAPSGRRGVGADADAWSLMSIPLLASTIWTMLLSVVGMRIVFALPLDLKANWIFRIAPVRGGGHCLAARRRAIIAIGVLPVWVGIAALLLSVWPWRAAAAHILVLGLLGAIVAEACLQGFQKIPFTCSYLPGKTNIHLTLLFCVLMLVSIIVYCAVLERSAMEQPASYLRLIAVLAVALLFARWRTAAQTDTDDIGIQFEDEGSPAIQGLGLSQ
jgi:hypothetical protein